MLSRIMTVCTGNICRSPLAEAELRQKLPSNFIISSSGLYAVTGAPAQENVQKLASHRGLDISAHEGTQITDHMVRDNDLILVMTNLHKKELEQQFPEAEDRVFLLGQWGAGEIPDPYGGGKALYASVDLQIQKAVEQWVPKLVKS